MITWVCLLLSKVGYALLSRMDSNEAIINYLIATTGIVIIAIYLILRFIKAEKISHLAFFYVNNISDGNLNTSIIKIQQMR